MDTPNVTMETDTGREKLRPTPPLLLLLRPMLKLKDTTDMDTGPEPLMAWDTTVILVLTTMADSGRGMLKLMPMLKLTTTTTAVLMDTGLTLLTPATSTATPLTSTTASTAA